MADSFSARLYPAFPQVCLNGVCSSIELHPHLNELIRQPQGHIWAPFKGQQSDMVPKGLRRISLIWGEAASHTQKSQALFFFFFNSL